MTTRSLAVIIDGVWQPSPLVNEEVHVHPVNARKNDGYVTIPSMSDIDQIVSLLGQVVLRAQSLPESDKRRVRDFVCAAQGMLTATTYLPTSDQRVFDAYLRDAAKTVGK
jgi:hypothetical protein